MRSIFGSSAETTEIEDWLADSGVRCELLSRVNLSTG
jgi:hypothetical protein